MNLNYTYEDKIGINEFNDMQIYELDANLIKKYQTEISSKKPNFSVGQFRWLKIIA